MPGRALVTGDLNDAFRFRTLPLRDVADTGPRTHNGAYSDLETAIRHHLDGVCAFEDYAAAEGTLPESVPSGLPLDEL